MNSTWVVIVLILISALPLIAVFVWYRLAKYPFSLYQFLFALLAGAAAFFPALLLQSLLSFQMMPGRARMFYDFFIRIALTEELSRLVMLLIFLLISGLLKSGEKTELVSYNKIKTGTAAGLVAGLGFAILESARYAASDPSVLLIRVFSTAPLHGACGSRIGASAVMLRKNPIQAIFRILTAATIHGVYNLMVRISQESERTGRSSGVPLIAAILIAISALVTAIMTIRGGWTEEPGAASGA